MLKYIYLIVGFVLLIKGADFFVEGSSSVAKKLRVPSIIRYDHCCNGNKSAGNFGKRFGFNCS